MSNTPQSSMRDLAKKLIGARNRRWAPRTGFLKPGITITDGCGREYVVPSMAAFKRRRTEKP